MTTPADKGPWRAGIPPTPAPQAVEPPEAEEDEEQQSTIKMGRIQDLYWVIPPTHFIWIIKSRRDRKRVAKSRMPLILRNLMPDSTFDPREMWENEKELMKAEQTQSLAAAEPDANSGGKAKGGKKDKKEKEKKISKKDEIIAKNEETQRAKEIASDWEKLDNSKGSVAKGNINDVLKVKTQTKVGGLRKLLMILETSLKSDNLPAAFDVLWAIEANELFKSAEESLKEKKDDKDDKKDKKEKKEKDGKKDKKDKKDDKKPAKSAPKTTEEQLVYDFKKEVKKAREHRKKNKMVEYQLTMMHDRLPPLSVYNRKFKLDRWQCRVLQLIDEDKSAIVCAPTSSGKTVISTYVAVKIAQAAAEAKAAKKDASGGGVLFVVPSEPLVWQVAAMFEKMVPGEVALCTDLMAYRPEAEFGKSSIVVGTPNALESSLSKVRGLVGEELLARGQDYAQIQGGWNFRYAVFDECHSLDGEEGGALQRIMRLVECPFLALSATIGNAEVLKEFWSSVRSGHKDCIETLKVPEDNLRDPQVHLERHEGRFINLQRLILSPNKAYIAKFEKYPFIKAEDAGKMFDLCPLHPCSAVNVETIRVKSFSELNISFTPRDSIALWGALDKFISDKASIAHLEPVTFFRQFGDPADHQITLAQAKEYESALKEKLEALAKDTSVEAQVNQVLAEFAVDPSTVDPSTRLFNFAMTCRDKQLFPCLCFQLDTFKCLEMFKELLGTLESRQRSEFPNYYKELEEKAINERKKALEAAKAASSMKKAKKDEDNDGGDEDMSETISTFIDTAAPHPSYVLSPPNARISAVEFDDILQEMKNDKEELPANHPIARGLRRGIGIYIDDVGLSGYRRVVQRLSQQGKLAIVFSDHSLAYGVNMPFRTCAFCGDMGGMLTPLMAQQMSGRTGRRGLDTQGNIVYLGMEWNDIGGLILGQVPDIRGVEHLYPTVSLLPVLSIHVDARAGRNACAASFSQFQDNTEASTSNYYDMSCRLMQELGLLNEDMSRAMSKSALTTCWEMRGSIAESLALVYCLPTFIQEFVTGKPPDYAEKENVQLEFFTRLLQFIDLHEPIKGVAQLPEVALADYPFITKYPERKTAFLKWEALVAQSQSRIAELPDDLKAELEATGAMKELLLPVAPGKPVDATILMAIVANKLPVDIPSTIKFDLKKRMFNIGNVLMKMHNCLSQLGDYQGLELVLRKCCTRVKWMLIDAMHNETSLTDVSGAIVRETEGVDELAAGAVTAASGGGVESVTSGVAAVEINES